MALMAKEKPLNISLKYSERGQTMPILEYLLQHYGVLMTTENLATVLKRSPDGLRVSLYSDTDISQTLGHARIKIGRHVLFRTHQVARALEQDDLA